MSDRPIFEEVKERFQAELDKLGPCPEITTGYFAYKEGEVKKFETLSEAKKFSNITEKVNDQASIDARKNWIAESNRIKKNITDAYQKELAKTYNLSIEEFAMIQSLASQVRATLNVDYDDDYNYEDHLDDIIKIYNAKGN